LSWRSPDRFSRTRTVWPLEAGIGAAPPSMAKAASLPQRPGWDQAHNTMAATIGPTPQRLSRSGSPGPDQGAAGPGVVGDLGVQEVDAAGQAPQGRGRGGGGLDIPGGLLAEPPAGGDQPRCGEVTQPSAERTGSSDHERVELALASVAAWTAEPRAASRTDSAAR
jgi:hypothetical protein